MSTTPEKNLFYTNNTHEYLYSNHADILQDNYIYFPLEVDTEFTHNQLIDDVTGKFKSTTLTVQYRSIDIHEGLILAHPENPFPRHTVCKHDVTALDYLEHLGYEVSMSKVANLDADMPIFQFDIYAFFAVAELLRVFCGEYREDVRRLITNPASSQIEQGRRLRSSTTCGGKYYNWVELPNWCLTLNGIKYRVRISIKDTCAVQGTVGYAGFTSNSGIVLKYKDNFTNAEKAHMGVMYKERTEDFDNYALGDLHNYNALIGNMNNFEKVYETLGLSNHFTPPRLTIGSTVSKILESAIINLFDGTTETKNIISTYCSDGSADTIKRITSKTDCLNAKVDGGRCRNNKPTTAYLKGTLCDIDISGCYGEGLRAQLYPLGTPMTIGYPINSTINDYQTLRQFLKKYRDELVPGLWQARVSTKPGYNLKHKQDILASWFPPKDISKMPTDTDFENTEQWWTVDNVGDIKILNNEVNYALITHDFIQWLDNVASVHQRKELLDNLIVITASFYMASERVDSIDKLVDKYKNHKGKNTTEARKYRRKNSKISIEQECYAWYAVNLGELIVDKLLIERKKHDKKTPLNTLYKLCVNTIYGDMVSPFFKVGNVIVGNNITARARLLAWYMEKGFNGHQTITDGCVFDMNKILYPRYDRRINGEMVVGLYADTKQYNYTYAPLSEFNINEILELNNQKIELIDVDEKPAIKIIDITGNGELLSPSKSLKWVDKYAMKHLQKLFSNVDILHQNSTDVYGKERVGLFEFESKGFYDTATFHGSANYSLAYNGDIKIAMRSYSKKKQLKAELVDNNVVIEDDYSPSEQFLKSLYNPSSVPRSKPYIKNAILKCGDYRRNYEKWHNTNAFPGCSVEIAGLLHEFSLSQFTFKTYEQYMGWKTEHERFLRKYGQSYEMFFMNNDGTLDFENMITTIDALIRDGASNFFKFCDKRAKHTYRNYKLHSQSDCLERVRVILTARYNGFYDADSLYGDEDFTVRE